MNVNQTKAMIENIAISDDMQENLRSLVQLDTAKREIQKDSMPDTKKQCLLKLCDEKQNEIGEVIFDLLDLHRSQGGDLYAKA